ncbi:class I SAM-dependent methyltransferase [Acetobacter fallax]|nr:SAM-dependent methyltransferase [Acetobacter fallax]
MPQRGAPERLDAFMARANAAYYAGRDPFADFVTAPEISQIFGELLGAWCAVVGQGILAGCTGGAGLMLVEAGPGRGTLMVDMVRVLVRVAPHLFATLSVHLIETSPRLRAAQKAALSQSGVSVTWHDGLESVPRGPMILVANEFLDALPIRQFVGEETEWRERFVQDGVFALSDRVEPSELAGRVAEPGEVVEICPVACAFVREVAARLCAEPGVALFIDYGTAVTASGETLQALRDGRPVSPLVEAGTADLTAHVDFEAIAHVAMDAGALCFGPVEQGELLVTLGAVERARALCAAVPDQANTVRTALDRLIAPERMGRLFKALAVMSPAGIAPGLVAPPGFPDGVPYGQKETR